MEFICDIFYHHNYTIKTIVKNELKIEQITIPKNVAFEDNRRYGRIPKEESDVWEKNN